MKKLVLKLIVIVLLIAVFLLILYYLAFYQFTGIKTPLAKACNKIEVGMEKETVLNIMKEFEKDNRDPFNEEYNYLGYDTPGLSGDWQCYIYLDEDNAVESVTRIFD